MQEFKDKVAVITGAASGIGAGLARRCAREGMRVVLADVEEQALFQTEMELKDTGTRVMSVVTDVSKAADVEALAQRAMEAFGAVHLLCNNAGVASGTGTIQSTLADWTWVLGVNLWGVIHGIQAFAPIMLSQGTPCHIVNTASVAGIISAPGNSPYRVSKHAVVALSETLHHELEQKEANVHISVLCPGFVNTRIVDAYRNRPRDLQNPPSSTQLSAEDLARIEAYRQVIQAGMTPDQVADLVITAVREEKFYILTETEWKDWVRTRMEDILQDRNPTPLHLGIRRLGG